MLYSTGGVGELDADFAAQTLPIHYKVLNASMTQRTKASKPGSPCADFGGTSGSTTFSGTSTGAIPVDDTNQLDAVSPGGPMSGRISAPVAATLSDDGKGCQSAGPVGLKPCSYAYSNVPIGTLSVSFTIYVANPASGDATLQWLLNAPGVGNFKDPCGILIWGDVPFEVATQTVPVARLLSNEPQGFTLAGSMHLDHDVAGQPASIDTDWDLSLSVERM